jgi:hypothetical protein
VYFPIPAVLLTSNFIYGFNSIDIDKSSSPSFILKNDFRQNTGSVSYVNLTYLNFRKWKCAPNTFYR